ncbi:MAG: MYXO-CTERM sorting domain-containing protein, partial [Myxococcota bacterium]
VDTGAKGDDTGVGSGDDTAIPDSGGGPGVGDGSIDDPIPARTGAYRGGACGCASGGAPGGTLALLVGVAALAAGRRRG